MLKLGLMRAGAAVMSALAMTVVAVPATAQQAVAESPGTALSRHIRVLASNPRDFNSLIGAGRAALELGDVQAAAGFFGRAEEVNPSASAAKVGLGAAMAHMGDADGAIFYFEQAQKLGAQPVVMAADRGMAKDLRGDLKGAQADYRLAISSISSDEARRRLALSLAIGHDRKAALDAIQPLLNRRDTAAQRTRAFILALVGDQIAAAQAIEAVMPGASARFAPFFRYLPNLSVTEKAAAVHLGIFPENAAERVALAQAQLPAPVQPTAVPPPPAVGGPAGKATPVRPAETKIASVSASRPSSLVLAGRIPERAAPRPEPVSAAPKPQQPAQPAFSLPSAQPVTASPSFGLPSASGAALTQSNEAPVTDKAGPADAAPALAAAEETAAEGNLSGIDKLLATLAEAPAQQAEAAPPPPEPKLEPKKVAASDKAAKAAAARKAAEKKARDEKLAAEKKAREEEARLGIKGTHWVQLAGGSNQDRMATEYRKLSAKAGKLLKSRSGYVTEGKDYYRLLVGPFASRNESQAFVNKLEKQGIDGFSWTRTPPKIKIEKL